MTAACHDAGLATPLLEEIGTRFRVTLYAARVGPSVLDAADQAILDALARDQGHATAEIAAVKKTIGSDRRWAELSISGRQPVGEQAGDGSDLTGV